MEIRAKKRLKVRKTVKADRKKSIKGSETIRSFGVDREKSLEGSRKSPSVRGAVLKKAELEAEPFDWSKLLAGKNLRVVAGGFSAVLLVMGVLLAISHTSGLKDKYKISHISIKGDFVQVEKSEIQESLSFLLDANYFDVDLARVHESLSQFLWIETVSVSRAWPDRVNIELSEHRVIAKWGKSGVLSKAGDIFFPKNINQQTLSNLPVLSGSETQSAMVLETYMNMSKAAEKYALNITELSLVADSYWQVSFEQDFDLFLDAVGSGEDGVGVNANVNERVSSNVKHDDAEFVSPKNNEHRNNIAQKQFVAFLRVFDSGVLPEVAELKRVDMRYHNGLSVVARDIENPILTKLNLLVDEHLERHRLGDTNIVKENKSKKKSERVRHG